MLTFAPNKIQLWTEFIWQNDAKGIELCLL